MRIGTTSKRDRDKQERKLQVRKACWRAAAENEQLAGPTAAAGIKVAGEKHRRRRNRSANASVASQDAGPIKPYLEGNSV